MPRMSREAQRKMGLTDEVADFDEFLQLDEKDPRHEALRKKLKARKVKGGWARSLDGLKKAYPR
jgi:hypothetical protein